MARESPIGVLTRLAEPWFGAFRGRTAVANGVTRKQLGTLHAHGVIERLLSDTYRLTAAPRCHEQSLSGALLWAGDRAVTDRRSAAMLYGLEGIRTAKPEIVVPSSVRCRSGDVLIRRCDVRRSLMVQRVRGLPVAGVEATLMVLAHELDDVALEIACEDARRRQLTSIPALHAYLDRFATPGRPGVAGLRRVVTQLDLKH